jgi:hypothetical protein
VKSGVVKSSGEEMAHSRPLLSFLFHFVLFVPFCTLLYPLCSTRVPFCPSWRRFAILLTASSGTEVEQAKTEVEQLLRLSAFGHQIGHQWLER